jgi:hypothetical protein
MRNLSSNANIKIAAEVTAINGKAIPDLLNTMNSFISTDGNNISARKDFLNTSWFNGLLAIALDFPREYIIDTKGAAGDPGQQIKLPVLNLETYNKLEAWPPNTPKF